MTWTEIIPIIVSLIAMLVAGLKDLIPAIVKRITHSIDRKTENEEIIALLLKQTLVHVFAEKEQYSTRTLAGTIYIQELYDEYISRGLNGEITKKYD